MAGTDDESTTSLEPSGPPTTVFFYPGGRARCTIVAIEALARPVAALPLHHFVPLNDALERAKGPLGSYSLAARDLTQHARGRRLTLGVRIIWPDGTEQVFILRRAFWRWYAIYETHRRVGDFQQEYWAIVRQVCGKSTTLLGTWHLFVGRRRLDRVFSTAAPSRAGAKPHSSATPVASAATSASSEWDPRTDWSVEKVFRELKLRGREPLRVVVKTLPKIYPDIPGALDRLVAEKPWMTAPLRNDIWPALEKEAGKKLRKGEVPSWDTCKDLLRAWHAWRHR
jgi:hypothetical protein